MKEVTRMRTALLFTLTGLVVQALCLYEVTPASFLVFALVAVPLVLVGLLLFLVAVWRKLKETKSL